MVAVAFDPDTVIVAVIVAILAPSVLAIGNARINRNNQKLQWERDDALEAKRIAREDAVAAQRELETQEHQKRLSAIEDQANVIHSLVNSELTQAYQRALDSMIASRDNLQKVISMTIASGEIPNPKDTEDLALMGSRISELEHLVLIRLQQQQTIDAKLNGGTQEEIP